LIIERRWFCKLHKFDFIMSTLKTIKTPKGDLEIETGLFINNEFRKSSDGKEFETINPSTSKSICTVQEASPEDVNTAVEAAEKAFEGGWRDTSGFHRSKIMHKWADLIERDIDELATLESLDNGKAFSISKGLDIVEVIKCIRYYAGWCDKIHGKVIETPQKLSFTRHEPIGVCAAIIPWNVPLLMFAWKVSPAIACANTVVVKSAEQTPLSALKACQLAKEAGFPPGVLNVVNGFGARTGEALARHMKVGKIAFTGSTATGRKILKAVAESNLKKVTLELGGKSPNIIFNDANLEQAVAWAHMGVFFNHGQVCCAGSRIYVQEGIYPEFMEAFRKRVATHPVGDPFDPSTYQGPQITEAQFNRIMHYIEAGKKEGAKVELGGKRHGTEGFFIEPTVFTDVKENMSIMQEEIFGPVAAIATFKDEDEVIRKAHDTVYGLAAAVFTNDVTRALRVATKLQAGTVWVNCYNQFDYNTPFGGYKESGMGRENGKYALANYTEVKVIKINLTSQL